MAHLFIKKTAKSRIVRRMPKAKATYTLVPVSKTTRAESVPTVPEKHVTTVPNTEPVEIKTEAVQSAPKETPAAAEKKPRKRAARKKKKDNGGDAEKEKGDDMDKDRIEKLKEILGDDIEVKKRDVKVEKKDKGLIERTSNSEILITEDNKILLND